jgi:preprotein translocase subunit YajC
MLAPSPTTLLDAPVLLAQAEGTGGGLAAFLPLILLMAVFWLLLVRPQQKRAKAQKELVNAVEVNDRVVTLGGMHGTVRYADDEIVHLEVAPGTQITFSKQAIARRLVDADTGFGEEA